MKNLFSTPDLPLATSLISRGMALTNLANEDGRAFFQFSDSPELRHLITKFWERKLSVDARTTLEEFRSLKQRISNAARR